MAIKVTKKIAYIILPFLLLFFSNEVGIVGTLFAASAADNNHLAPAAQVNVQGIKNAFISVEQQLPGGMSTAERSEFDLVFDQTAAIDEVIRILTARKYSRIGEGGTTMVFEDDRKEFVIKVPFKTLQLQSRERDFINRNFILRAIERLANRYVPQTIGTSMKNFIKYYYYKYLGRIPAPDKFLFNGVIRGYEVAQKHHFRHIIRTRVIPNILGELSIKGLRQRYADLESLPYLIVNERIDTKKILGAEVRNAMKAGNIDYARYFYGRAFDIQMDLWREGGYDLDGGVNLLDNMVRSDRNGGQKLLDAGALTDVHVLAVEFMREKEQQVKEIRDLLRHNSLQDTVGELSSKTNAVAHRVNMILKDYPGEAGEQLALFFLEQVEKYYTVSNFNDIAIKVEERFQPQEIAIQKQQDDIHADGFMDAAFFARSSGLGQSTNRLGAIESAI